MKERSIYLLLSLTLLFLFKLDFNHLQKSLHVHDQFDYASVKKISLDVGSINRINLDALNWGTRYIAVLRSGLESINLHTYKLPYLREALPNVKGTVPYRIKLGAEDFSSELTFSPNILNRISNTIRKESSGEFQIAIPIIDLTPTSADDFLELSVHAEGGQLNGAYIEIYKVDNLSDLLLFYPVVLEYMGFICALFATAFFFLAIFGFPKENSLYSFLICFLFGLLGFDMLIRGRFIKFLLKLLTLGGCGIIYAFDLGKEFFGLVLKRSY